SACVGRGPRSYRCGGALVGAWVSNDIDPFGRKAGDLVVRDGPSARSRLLLRVPWQLRARSTRRGRAWLRGVPGGQETARSAVSCTGLRGASSHSTVFPRVSSLRHGIQL